MSAKFAARALKPLDRKRAAEATSIAANSRFISDRITRAWGRESAVIYPPVDVTRISSSNWTDRLSSEEETVIQSLPEDFILGASRFVEYKRLDLVIRAGEAANMPVVLAGSGPLAQKLRHIAASATVPVYFVSTPSDNLLFALYQKCSVLVFPPIEDFGIVPVEAMAAGAPVVANTTGGASESVIHGTTGALTDFARIEAIGAAVEIAISARTDACVEQARSFSTERFQSEIKNWMRQ
jgi:glycosyltransferase involved in cell wall biosynthesis